MSKLISGAANIFVEGVLYASTGEFTAQINNVSREEIITADGEVYYSETPVASHIEGNILLTEKLKPSILIDAVDATVQVQTRSGHTVMLSGAFFSGDGSMDAKEGKLSIKFTGKGKYVV